MSSNEILDKTNSNITTTSQNTLQQSTPAASNNATASNAPAAASSRKSSTAAGGSGSSDEEGDAAAVEETERSVAALLAEVKSSLVDVHPSGTGTKKQQQHEADEKENDGGEADATAGDGDEDDDEESDKVHVSDHLNMAELTLAEQDEASSNLNSASNSVSASPAIFAGTSSASSSSASIASAAAQAMQALPPLEMKDGGNAVMPAPTAATSASTSDAAADGGAAHMGAKANFFDVRVAVVGNVDSGKSTLIGTLCGGVLDNGRGLARSKVFIHAHELGTGRTSAISQHLMGFDTEGKPVHQTVAASAQSVAKSKSWAQVVAASRSVMTFIDLAGHEKYLKTTIAGLTGSHPDYALVIINSLAGVTKMTREHLGVVLALEIPLICVVSKVDLAPSTVLEASKKQLFRILKSSAANKMPIQMRNEADIETVITNSENSHKLCPVFFISAVDGTHIDLLTSYLSRLRPHHEWLTQYATHVGPDGSVSSSGSNPTAVEFSIDEVFNVSGIGIVVSGTLNSGTLTPNSTLLLGPQSDNSFVAVLVRSLHYKRVNCASVEAGQSCAVSIRAVRKKETLKRNLIRRGQVLVDPVINPKSTRIFDAEVLILHHPTTIKLGYQAVLHCGMIRQTAQICRIQKECLRTGDKSICRFRFLLRDEYLHVGSSFVFREGSTKGIGKVVRINFTEAERAEMEADDAMRKKGGGPNGANRSQQPSTKDKLSVAAVAAAKAAQEAATGAGAGGAAADVPAAAAAAAASSSSSSSASAVDASDASAIGGAGKQKWSNREKVEYQKAKGDGKSSSSASAAAATPASSAAASHDKSHDKSHEKHEKGHDKHEKGHHDKHKK